MLTLAQLLRLKLLVAQHLAASTALAIALRTGTKEYVLEADGRARSATEEYLKYTDSLLEDGALEKPVDNDEDA